MSEFGFPSIPTKEYECAEDLIAPTEETLREWHSVTEGILQDTRRVRFRCNTAPTQTQFLVVQRDNEVRRKTEVTYVVKSRDPSQPKVGEQFRLWYELGTQEPASIERYLRVENPHVIAATVPAAELKDWHTWEKELWECTERQATRMLRLLYAAAGYEWGWAQI